MKPREWKLWHSKTTLETIAFDDLKHDGIHVIEKVAYDELKAKILYMCSPEGQKGFIGKISALREERNALKAENERLKHEFKNFHSILCERFNYCHDDVDWKRDQLSLIEHIAKERDELKAALEELLNWAKHHHQMPGYSEVILNAHDVLKRHS